VVVLVLLLGEDYQQVGGDKKIKVGRGFRMGHDLKRLCRRSDGNLLAEHGIAIFRLIAAYMVSAQDVWAFARTCRVATRSLAKHEKLWDRVLRPILSPIAAHRLRNTAKNMNSYVMIFQVIHSIRNFNAYTVMSNPELQAAWNQLAHCINVRRPRGARGVLVRARKSIDWCEGDRMKTVFVEKRDGTSAAVEIAISYTFGPGCPEEELMYMTIRGNLKNGADTAFGNRDARKLVNVVSKILK